MGILREGRQTVTRRERHLRIIKAFGDPLYDTWVRRHLESLIVRGGRDLSVFTDEAVEALARSLLSSYAFQQRERRKAAERERMGA